MPSLLHSTLQTRFGLTTFRRGQEEILASVMSNRDTLAVMPTGGGKSLCYQLPSVCRPGITVVISPLIALMKDQVDALNRKGIAAGALYSGQSREEKLAVFAKMRERESYLLYLSPERVQKEGFQTWVRRAPVTLFAIDEAHCLSQWGPDFRTDYYKLSLLRELRPDVPILALTATATPQVIADISRCLALNHPDRHVYGFYRPNLYYQVELCEDEDERIEYLQEAIARTPSGRIIVYAGTRKNCEELGAFLSKRFGAGVGFYHAGLTPDERTHIQGEYERGKLRILIATNAFGMGIDHPDVRLVVHVQLPANIESYYQEIGRAGRDGEPSTCLLLYRKKDKGLISHFIRQSDAEPHIIHRRWRALETMIVYAEGGECRHSGILTYFKDTQRITSCGHCDVCAPESHRRVPKPELAPTSRLRKSAGRKKHLAAAAPDTPLTPEQELHRELLRDWRMTYARERDLPAFMIFSDRTLHDLVRKAPRTESDLGNVYGLGEKKIEAFGREILKALGH